jgi:isopenicillin N synthase-like dioxygenase
MSGPPTIDLASTPPGALAEALVESSCALIVGHGVAADLRAEMASVSARFFDLPEEEKALVRWPGTGQWKGWQPVYAGAAELTGERVPDLVERFEVQEIDDFGMWPSEPTGLRATWVAYYRACAALASELMVGIAGALDLPSADMAAWTTRQYANLVVNNYPAQPDAPLPGQVRVGPHTDRGGFTLLAADDAPGGLEVRLPGSRDWIAVQIPADAFLVQAGDLLSRWTNRLIRANAHRVVNPPRQVAATARRQAVVYFHYPALDHVVAPAPSCIAASGNPPLEPLHAGEHLMHRQAAFAVASAERYGDMEDFGDLDLP